MFYFVDYVLMCHVLHSTSCLCLFPHPFSFNLTFVRLCCTSVSWSCLLLVYFCIYCLYPCVILVCTYFWILLLCFVVALIIYLAVRTNKQYLRKSNEIQCHISTYVHLSYIHHHNPT